MTRFLRDEEYTAQRIAELAESVTYARYELAAAVQIAHSLGMPDRVLGEALGVSRQGAQQFRQRQVATGEMSWEEKARIGRLIGVGEKVDRFEVRIITSGKPGVSRVVRETLSRHLKLEVAERRARERGPDAEVWRISPDGTAVQVPVRPPMASRGGVGPAGADEAF